MQVVDPMISVVMSVYKEPIDWLHQSIDSILNQTFKDFEFIIICDNPDYEEGISILREYVSKDKRIVLLFNIENIGLTKSLNKGLSIAKGNYIARMDADDISVHERFSNQLNFMQSHPDIDVCGTNIKLFGAVSLFSEKSKRFPKTHDEIVSMMLFDNPFAHSSIMMKKIIKGKCVKYDENVSKAQDYKLWCDLYCCGAKFSNIDKFLLKYRVSENQISSRANLEQKSTADMIRGKLLEKYVVPLCDTDIKIHNEICKFIKTDVPFQKKIEWITFLKGKISNSDYLNRYLFGIWSINCIAYSKFKYLFYYPQMSFGMLINTSLLKTIIKHFVMW